MSNIDVHGGQAGQVYQPKEMLEAAKAGHQAKIGELTRNVSALQSKLTSLQAGQTTATGIQKVWNSINIFIAGKQLATKQEKLSARQEMLAGTTKLPRGMGKAGTIPAELATVGAKIRKKENDLRQLDQNVRASNDILSPPANRASPEKIKQWESQKQQISGELVQLRTYQSGLKAQLQADTKESGNLVNRIKPATTKLAGVASKIASLLGGNKTKATSEPSKKKEQIELDEPISPQKLTPTARTNFKEGIKEALAEMLDKSVLRDPTYSGLIDEAKQKLIGNGVLKEGATSREAFECIARGNDKGAGDALRAKMKQTFSDENLSATKAALEFLEALDQNNLMKGHVDNLEKELIEPGNISDTAMVLLKNGLKEVSSKEKEHKTDPNDLLLDLKNEAKEAAGKEAATFMRSHVPAYQQLQGMLKEEIAPCGLGEVIRANISNQPGDVLEAIVSALETKGDPRMQEIGKVLKEGLQQAVGIEGSPVKDAGRFVAAAFILRQLLDQVPADLKGQFAKGAYNHLQRVANEYSLGHKIEDKTGESRAAKAHLNDAERVLFDRLVVALTGEK